MIAHPVQRTTRRPSTPSPHPTSLPKKKTQCTLTKKPPSNSTALPACCTTSTRRPKYQQRALLVTFALCCSSTSVRHATENPEIASEPVNGQIQDMSHAPIDHLMPKEVNSAADAEPAPGWLEACRTEPTTCWRPPARPVACSGTESRSIYLPTGKYPSGQNKGAKRVPQQTTGHPTLP